MMRSELLYSMLSDSVLPWYLASPQSLSKSTLTDKHTPLTSARSRVAEEEQLPQLTQTGKPLYSRGLSRLVSYPFLRRKRSGVVPKNRAKARERWTGLLKPHSRATVSIGWSDFSNSVRARSARRRRTNW